MTRKQELQVIEAFIQNSGVTKCPPDPALEYGNELYWDEGGRQTSRTTSPALQRWIRKAL